MIRITSQIVVPDSELTLTFVSSPGPGGQNVNKLATAVLLRFNVLSSPSLPETMRARLIMLLGKKMTTQGDLIIKASRFRTQERNKQDALARFVEWLKRAAILPKKRRKTKPTKSSVQQRLSNKKIHAKKKLRRSSKLDNF